jgi:hypothetical protein
MTFEEWADRTFGEAFKEEETLTYIRMSAAWEVATKAEREACAKVCEQWDMTAGSRLAVELRARSN